MTHKLVLLAFGLICSAYMANVYFINMKSKNFNFVSGIWMLVKYFALWFLLVVIFEFMVVTIRSMEVDPLEPKYIVDMISQTESKSDLTS